MGRVISISNQKGGVGKTTTAINLSAGLSKLGRKVLLIDMDPQGNAGRGFGIDVTGVKNTTVELLLGHDLGKVGLYDEATKVTIVPSNLRLASYWASEAGNIEKPYFILKDAIKDIRNQFDYVIVDCPPSLGLLNINALVASDSVIIPVQCEYFAMEAVAAILSSIASIQRNYSPDLKIEGLLLTMYDSRTKLATDVMTEVKSLFKETMFHSVVPRNISVAEAIAMGQPVTYWRPSASGSLAYFALAREVIDHE